MNKITVLIYTITFEFNLIFYFREFLLDKLGDYHIIVGVEVFIERLHDVVVGVQVHDLSL